MKILTPTRGIIAVRLPQNGYAPLIEHSFQYIFNAVQTKFGFMASPASALPNSMSFQNGQIRLAQQWAKIHLLILEPNGAYVDCSTTDVSEEVLKDLNDFYDNVLQYKIAESKKEIYYYSVVVVEFNKSIDSFINPSRKIGHILSPYRSTQELFGLRKIEFGWGDVPQSPSTSQIDAVERATFSIEKRIGYSASDNVYFCAAPMRTEDHIAVLEEIEKIL